MTPSGTCVTVILRVNARVASLLQASLSPKTRGRHHIALAGSTSMFWVTAGTDYHTNGGYPKEGES